MLKVLHECKWCVLGMSPSSLNPLKVENYMNMIQDPSKSKQDGRMGTLLSYQSLSRDEGLFLATHQCKFLSDAIMQQ